MMSCLGQQNEPVNPVPYDGMRNTVVVVALLLLFHIVYMHACT